MTLTARWRAGPLVAAVGALVLLLACEAMVIEPGTTGQTTPIPEREPAPNLQPTGFIRTGPVSGPLSMTDGYVCQDNGRCYHPVATDGWLQYKIATVYNSSWDGPSAPTTLRLYRYTYQSDEWKHTGTCRSRDGEVICDGSGYYIPYSAIPESAEEVWTKSVPDIPAESAFEIEEYAAFSTPVNSGLIYFTLCVDPVPDESDTDNNCWQVPLLVSSELIQYWNRSRSLITDDDPSAFTTNILSGEGTIRTFYPRRHLPVYRFTAQYADLSAVTVYVDKELPTGRAWGIATSYARTFGQLPAVLRRSVREIHVIKELVAGGYASYPNTIAFKHRDDSDGVGEAALHEAAHIKFPSSAHRSAAWQSAMQRDGQHITRYATNNSAEDVAESTVVWYAVRCRADRLFPAEVEWIKATIPHRLAYLDGVLGGASGCR